jgi:hypothetical protein
MLAVDATFDVDGFLEVRGQEMAKSEHLTLFEVLRGNVIDKQSTFLLPTKKHISTYFSNFNPDTMKIVIKVQ